MRTSVSIVLFFLLSAFFLFALLAALNRSRRSLLISSGCLIVVVCIIVFLTPVRLPRLLVFDEKEGYQRHMDTIAAPGSSGVPGETPSTISPEDGS